MSQAAPESSLRAQRMRDFFLARQPILNREQELVAYELLFRSAAAGPANVTNDLFATASVMAHAAELGMENVIGASLGFLNVNAAVLTSDIVRFLPKEKIVLEILETVKVTDRLVARVAELAAEGYRFALDDITADTEDVQKLLPLVEVVKVDIAAMEGEKLTRLAREFKAAQKKLLAEKVENLSQFQNCLDLGFDYFQGYYFAKPFILSGKKLSPSQLAIVQLMGQLASEADTADIARTIKQDASLGLMLLRLVNTPAAGVSQRIDSLGQALTVLGRRQVQRWLQILLYAEPKKAGSASPPLLTLATTRGRMLELMAEKLQPGNRNVADLAFTVGIMSLMDVLFGMPMENILEKLSVADDVRKALQSRQGLYGDMLKLAESIERLEEAESEIAPLLIKLQLRPDDFYEIQLAAFEWSDSIARDAA